MAILKIARMGHPILRRVAAAVAPADIPTPEIQHLIDDMVETMHDACGAGIAAPQVHRSLRIAVMQSRNNPRYPEFPDIPLLVMINPILSQIPSAENDSCESDSITMVEGCLSIPNIRGKVTRPRRIRIQALDRQGKPYSFDWQGVPAAVVQHEVDHLDGVLFVDRVDPRSLGFLEEHRRYASEP